MKTAHTIRVEGSDLSISNATKLLWPRDKYTKAHLLEYYANVAWALLPHLRDRPLVLTRYPDGIDGKWFYQKDLPDHAPPWIESLQYRSTNSPNKITRFCLCQDLRTLIWLANEAAIEIHPWLSRTTSLDYPDFMVFDLDPAYPATFEDARRAAKLVQEFLRQLKLNGYVKLSGATGIHIYVPCAPVHTYETIRSLAYKISIILLQAAPELITLERTVSRRAGKVYLDYLQNAKGKTLVAPYAPRPLPGAPVSTPINWEELDSVEPGDFNIATVPERARKLGDLFAGVLTDKQQLSRLIELCETMPLSIREPLTTVHHRRRR